MTNVTTTPFPLGVYVGGANVDTLADITAFDGLIANFTTLMGAAPEFSDTGANDEDPESGWLGDTQWDANAWSKTPATENMTPVIGLPMASYAAGTETGDQMFQDFIAGKYDQMIIGGVEAWAQAGYTTQYWKPGWEMNLLSSMPWYAGTNAQTAADFVAAFQHIYTVLHEAGAEYGVNVQVVWNPGTTPYGAVDTTTALFPGANYVDVIGADVYQIDDPSSSEVANGQALTLQDLINLAKSTGKPLAISEAGNDTNSPAFAQWLAQTLTQGGVPIAYVNLWDAHADAFSGPTATQPALAAAFAEYFGADAVNPLLGSIAGSVLSAGAGLSGVTVTLLGSTGAAVGTTTTDANGAFSFTGITAGTYQVQYTAPTGQVLQTGSAANSATGLTTTITVATGQAVSLAPELMLSNPGTIQASVLHFGASTDPVGGSPEAGVTVSLLNASAAVVATTVSNSAGAVSFTNLAAGTYELQYAPPTGQAIEPGTSATTAPVTLAAGQSITAASGDMITLATLSGSVSLAGAGEAGVTVALLNAAGTAIATTTTSSAGTYNFANVLPGTYTVKYTAPKGQVLQNGSQASIATGLTAPVTLVASETASLPAELLLSNPSAIEADAQHFGGPTDPVYGGSDGGVVVQLLNGAGQVIATTASNSGGWFDFIDLAAGTYQLQYLIPAGQALEPGTTALTKPITLGAGQGVWAANGEFVSLGSVSGTVMAGGAGEAGVAVALLNAAGTVVATTISASTGAFSFADLVAGSYQVKYTAPQGLVLQTGSEANSVTGLSPSFTVANSQTVTLAAESLLANPGSISANVLHVTGAANASSLGAAAGMTASLLNAAGQVIATATPSSSGQFSFGQLAAGIYQLQYTTASGQAITPSTVGLTTPFTLGAGQSVWAPNATLVTAISLTGSGKSVSDGAGFYVVSGTASHSTVTLGAGSQSVTLTGTANTVITGNGNQTIALSGTANSITVGTGTSTIKAGRGQDTVHAAGGNVTISATGAGNVFDSGAGMAFLTADGSAGNIFMLNPAATGTMTTITGFNLAAGDILDIKRTLAGTGVAANLSNVASYITAATTGANTTLYVDPTGGHGTASAFAVLNGIHTTVAALQSAHDFSLS